MVSKELITAVSDIDMQLQHLWHQVTGGDVQAGMRSSYPDAQWYLERDIASLIQNISTVMTQLDVESCVMNRVLPTR